MTSQPQLLSLLFKCLGQREEQSSLSVPLRRHHLLLELGSFHGVLVLLFQVQSSSDTLRANLAAYGRHKCNVINPLNLHRLFSYPFHLIPFSYFLLLLKLLGKIRIPSSSNLRICVRNVGCEYLVFHNLWQCNNLPL